MEQKLVRAFQEQINFESYSGYLYLSMYAWATLEGWSGFANWLNVQAEEERTHSYILHEYLLERSESPDFNTIQKPKSSWDNLTKIFEEVLEHEKEVTRRINNLATLAKEVNDHSAYDLLILFVKEQHEEENNATELLTSLKRIQDSTAALYALDEKLKARTFVFPFPSLNKQ